MDGQTDGHEQTYIPPPSTGDNKNIKSDKFQGDNVKVRWE